MSSTLYCINSPVHSSSAVKPRNQGSDKASVNYLGNMGSMDPQTQRIQNQPFHSMFLPNISVEKEVLVTFEVECRKEVAMAIWKFS